MANCLGLPEEANWVQSQAALGEDYTVLVPWPLPSLTQQPNVSSFNSNGYPPWSTPLEGVGEDRSMDKAHLLATVVDHVKELKRKASEVYKVLTLPTEVDEVTVDCELDQDFLPSKIDQSKSCVFIKASLCCDDRPELFSELIQALKDLKLTTVRADMASLGGRIKGILVLCSEDAEEGICVNTLKQALEVALSRLASSSTVPTNRMTSKRQRFFFPSTSLQRP
ncbi:hypothetical protein RJ641_035886 [Dillenia turbinata]|uniref:Transcription factor bHLH51 n=1 Tax=Dillenia turbinata TaxID=194707 RepID=A0AAN8VNX0_9MAGN